MKTALNLKVDKIIKDQAKDLAKMIGIPLSTIMNGFLAQFVRDQGIAFNASYTLRPEVAKELDEILADPDYENSFVGPFSTRKELEEYVESL